ncbi:acidic fibroblast growth factor binding protein [Chytridium lagenaria]|nr:acidic fibroblast growth factor binding protein [Chytridium lagenaria]
MFSAFVGTQFTLDRTVWHLWLMGLSVEAASQFIRKKNRALPDEASAKIFVLSQFRNFEMLESFLHRPRSLLTQLIFPLSPETVQYLVDTYYSFEPKVLREVLGKKLSSRARKELDDAHEKSRVPMQGCRRMFDNLRRLMKRVEDAEGDMQKIIQSDFLIQKELASKYSHVIFINIHRLDCSKKKLANMSFDDFEQVGSLLMQYCTSQTTAAVPDMDVALAQDARDLKAVMFNRKEVLEEYRLIIQTRLQASERANIFEKCGVSSFKVLLRNVFSIGSGLSYTKELKDIFTSLVEKVLEPCQSFGWSASDVELFFTLAIQEFSSLESITVAYRKKYAGSYQRMCLFIQRSIMHLL